MPRMPSRPRPTWFALGLLLLLAGCDDRAAMEAYPRELFERSLKAENKRFHYVVGMAGPHLILPAEVAGAWKGGRFDRDMFDPKTDLGRAFASINEETSIAPLPVGDGSALMFAPLGISASSTSSDGYLDIYSFGLGERQKLDAAIMRARAECPTDSMTPTGVTLTLHKPDVYLIFAADTVTQPRETRPLPLKPGQYTVLTGLWKSGKSAIRIFRFKPTEPDATQPDAEGEAAREKKLYVMP